MNLLIVIILILGGCSYIFDLIWTLYLTFSNNVKQDNYGDAVEISILCSC